MKNSKPRKGMHHEAPASSFAKAQKLRENQTEAESLLWEKLSNKQLNDLKFRRQHPLGVYILDFYCHQYKLAIEVDGEYHLSKDQILIDEERTQNLECSGIMVIRFTNQQVISNLEQVLQEIIKQINNLKD